MLQNVTKKMEIVIVVLNECHSDQFYANIPMWLVANCSSMLSFESMKGVAIIPALLLKTKKDKINPLLCDCLVLSTPEKILCQEIV